MADKIKLRRDSSTNWSNVNPILDSGEIGIVTNLKKLKIGDGSTEWNLLPFASITAEDLATALLTKADKATTLGGYNITDAYTKTEMSVFLEDKANKTDTYNKIEVNTIANQKIATASIVNLLTSDSEVAPLAAAQGKVLKQYIDDITSILTSDDTSLDELQEIVTYIKQNKSDLQDLSVENIAGLEDALSSVDVSPLSKPIITSPLANAIDFIGQITWSFATSENYAGVQDYVLIEIATDTEFNDIIDSYEGSENLVSFTPNIGLPLTNIFIRIKTGSDNHRSKYSDTVMFTTPDVYVETPTITLSGEPSDIGETPTIILSGFSVYNGTDTQSSSSYKIIKVSDGSTIWQSPNDAVNLLSITIPGGLFETSTAYRVEVHQTGTTYGDSALVSKSFTTKENFRAVMGRIWNVTDDTYKRYKDGLATLSAPTELEFTSWLSPTAERVNDDDTTVPSDLTTELDTNASLPFKNIARKVVTTTSDISEFDHSTAPLTTEQIMTQIEKTYYVQALVVADGKEYDIQIVSLEPFTIDVVNDLGFTAITSITCFNPTAGISSGTVAGNIITSALHPAFVWHNDDEADLTFIGSFPSISGRSTFGAKATDSITLPTARTQHTSFGTNFNQHDFWNNSLVQILAYIERGSNYLEGSLTKWDGHAKSGLSTGDVQNTGLTLSLENKTGVIKHASGYVIANSYRGIENYHSNLRMWVDGININATRIYLAKAGSAYASDTDAAPYFDSGYNGPSSSGNIEKWQAGTFIPDPTTGGDSTTQVTDYMYGTATGFKVLTFGGSLAEVGSAGLSYWHGAYASSKSLWLIVSRSSLRKFF